MRVPRKLADACGGASSVSATEALIATTRTLIATIGSVVCWVRCAMTQRRFGSLSAIMVCLFAARSATAQRPAVRDDSMARRSGATCYRLTVGAWRSSVGPDTAYHRVPTRVRLDTLHWDANGRHLSPRMTYPAGSSTGFPRTPRWETSGDTVRLIWSNGFAVTVVTLVRAGATLAGEAVAESDAHPIPAPPIPRATVTGEPISCDST